jgi:two-component system response regulator CpxR
MEVLGTLERVCAVAPSSVLCLFVELDSTEGCTAHEQDSQSIVRVLHALLSRIPERAEEGDTVVTRRAGNVLRVDDLELDPAARRVLRAGREVLLTGAEFALLQTLMESAGKPMGREELVDRALGRQLHPLDRSLDVHVSRLRRKLATDGRESQVKTIRGTGYQIVVRGSLSSLSS